MSVRKLPPLLAGGCYTCPPLSNIDFTPPDLERELKGETTSLMCVTLSNGVRIELPVRAFQLQMLMSGLIRVFPQQAMANLRVCQKQPETQGGSGRMHGARES